MLFVPILHLKVLPTQTVLVARTCCACCLTRVDRTHLYHLVTFVPRMNNIQIHTCVVANGEFCYCRLCCDQRINYHTQKSFEQLEIDIELEFDSEERAINTVFQHVFTQICMSKAYRNKIEIESGYKRPFFYFRTQMSDEEARTKAKRIVEDCQVFNKFDKVLENLLRLCRGWIIFKYTLVL